MIKKLQSLIDPERKYDFYPLKYSGGNPLTLNASSLSTGNSILIYKHLGLTLVAWQSYKNNLRYLLTMSESATIVYRGKVLKEVGLIEQRNKNYGRLT